MFLAFRKKYIGDRAFYKMLMSITIPIMIQNGITNFVSLLDNIMVGQLGTEPMSGVAIVNQLIFIFYLLIFGGLSGVGIFTAQYFGNKDNEGIRHTFRYKLWMGFIITVLTIFILIYFGDQLVGLYLKGAADGGDPKLALKYAREYIDAVVFMLPAVYISQVYTSTLRECGETFVPMVSGVVAVITNLVLDYALIFGKLGLPEMGVVGAAVATVIARYIETAVVIVWAVTHTKTHTYFKGIFRTVLVPGKLVKKYFITGVPILVNEGLWSIGVAMLSQAYSLRGLNVVAGQNIASTINNIFNIVFIAMGDAVAIIIGQRLGAGEMERAKDEDNKIIAFAIFTSIVIGAALFFTSGLFPKLYNTSELSKTYATGFIMVQACAMSKDAFLHTSYFTIRAGGKTFITFLFDSVFMVLVSVPFANVLVRYTTISAVGIFALVHAADLLKCIVGYLLLKKNVWMKNIVR